MKKFFKKLWYNTQKQVFRFIGDVKFSGITRPFWFTINARGYKIKGEHYRSLAQIIKPGDILVRKFDGYVDAWLIPGDMNHAGVYIGGKKEQVVHALSEGVIKEDLLNFMRTDHMMVLRPDAKRVRYAIKKAKGVVGTEYDFEFNFSNSLRLSCTELVDVCYPGSIKAKKRFGRKTIVADDIVGCKSFKIVWRS